MLALYGGPIEVRTSRGDVSLIRIGTSGWNYPHWRGRFYPADLAPKDWFTHYCRHFCTVEINATFYGMPSEATVRAWRQQAPGGFLYAVKAHRYITHVRRLANVGESVQRFLDLVAELGGHLGPLLFQLPPRWRRRLDRLDVLLSTLRGRRWRVVEFRDPDWLHPDTFRLLRRHRTALCIHDLIPGHPRELTGTIVYVRFHGVGERYGGSYDRSCLKEWAEWMVDVARGGRHVFAYFNNDAYAHAVRNALELIDLVQSRR